MRNIKAILLFFIFTIFLFLLILLNVNSNPDTLLSLASATPTPTPTPSPAPISVKDFDNGADYETPSYVTIYSDAQCINGKTSAEDWCNSIVIPEDKDRLNEMIAKREDGTTCGEEECCPKAGEVLISCGSYCFNKYSLFGECKSVGMNIPYVGLQQAGYCWCYDVG